MKSRKIGRRSWPSGVEVREGDAYETGLPRASFDGAHMRLVLVNVPEPERIVREMVSLVRPGGWVASFEADFAGLICDPQLPEWTRLLDAYIAYSAAQGIDLFIGRRTHRVDPDFLELRVRIRGEIGDLALQACLLGLAATQQIVVRLRHGTLFPSGKHNEV
jgi:ubiquinone/menaquinone biosynthesis C-methylase UbiE